MFIKNTKSLVQHILLISIFVFAMLELQPAKPVHASTFWYVATTGSDSNSCSVFDVPCLTIHSADTKVDGDDTISVAEGTYTGPGREVVHIGQNVTISGGWNRSFTIRTGFSMIDGQNACARIRACNKQSSTLEWFIVITTKRRYF